MFEGAGSAERYTFPRREHLRERKDIDRAFGKGVRFSVRGLRLLVLSNGTAETRALFVPVRKYGGSVRRNKARRLASEAFRQLKPHLASGHDFVFVLYPGTDTFKERSGQVERVLRLAGVLPREA